MRFFINAYRLIPLYFFIKLSGAYGKIAEEAVRWGTIYKYDVSRKFRVICKLMLETIEYRNLLQKRLREFGGIGKAGSKVMHVLFPPMNTLYINTDAIGKNLFIQHGFATVISAKSIGDDCWINQQVTIGYEGDKHPVIGNNVRICAGAIVIGDVTVGDNSIIGAGAVVTKNVPANEVWGGVPAKFIKKVEKES